MTRARASLPLPLLGISTLAALATLTVAACATERKPLTGFDHPPPGSIVLDSTAGGGGGSVVLWPMFDAPLGQQQPFRVRLGGQDVVMVTSAEGFYDYARLYLGGWTAGWSNWLTGIPPGTYVVELVDGLGMIWGQSEPLAIPAGPGLYAPGVQLPNIVFANFDGIVASWNIDPATQDANQATDEITVTSLVDENLVVERCLVVSGKTTTCTPVGTVAAGGDLRTVETIAGKPNEDHQALVVRLASDARQYYQRDLVEGISYGPSACQLERIIVHGNRGQVNVTPSGSPSIAMSSCFGYSSGPM